MLTASSGCTGTTAPENVRHETPAAAAPAQDISSGSREAPVASPRETRPAFTHPAKSRVAPLLPAHMRTPEREPVVEKKSTPPKIANDATADRTTPTRREWDSGFVEKPSEEYRRKLADRRTLIGGSPATPHTSRMSGEVNQLRGSNKRLMNVSPRIDSGLRHSPSKNSDLAKGAATPQRSRSNPHSAQHHSSPERGLTRTPGGTCFRVPKPVPSARSPKTPSSSSLTDKLRKSSEIQSLSQRVSELEEELAAERKAHEETRGEKERAEELHRQERAIRIQMENLKFDSPTR